MLNNFQNFLKSKNNMKTKALALFSCLIFFVGFWVNAFGDDHTADQNKAAKEFTLEGIGLGATYSAVKAKHPDIEFVKDKSDAKVGLAIWKTYSSKAVDIITFNFLDGKLYKIEVFYMDKTLDKFGGYKTVYEKLVAKYGKEDETSDDEKFVCDYTWQFFDADRFMNYYIVKTNYSGYLVVVDKALTRQLTEKKKANANVGF